MAGLNAIGSKYNFRPVAQDKLFNHGVGSFALILAQIYRTCKYCADSLQNKLQQDMN